MKGYKRYDKNTIRLPRQEFPLHLNFLILYGFLHDKEIFYNVFTTFERYSDMIFDRVK